MGLMSWRGSGGGSTLSGQGKDGSFPSSLAFTSKHISLVTPGIPWCLFGARFQPLNPTGAPAPMSESLGALSPPVGCPSLLRLSAHPWQF